MKKNLYFFVVFLCIFALSPLWVEAVSYKLVTISNDPGNNELLVYDANGNFAEAIPTEGSGGVPRNTTGGGIAKMKNLLAVVNYGSQSVSLFKENGGSFTLVQVFSTLSKPVSLAFAYDHLYVLGTNTVESHVMHENGVSNHPDGFTKLYVGDGSGAQVGVLPNQLIISERSNTLELVDLRQGVVTNSVHPIQLPPPPDNNTPVGLVTRGDAAYVTIAHSDKVGLVKNGKLVKLISSESQHAPCWLTLMGPWLFCSNTPSKSISRYKASPGNIELVNLIAAKTQAEPSDLDAEGGILAVLEGSNGVAYVTQFGVDEQGNLKHLSSAPTATSAIGIAVVPIGMY